MFDHLGLRVRDIARATSFYADTLAPLGHSLQSEGDGYAGFGPDGAPSLWLHAQPEGPVTGAHVAFKAPNRKAVHEFHARALAQGGQDNGGPGPRPHYGETYYAAYVLDLDGNNIEAVTFAA